ncbi:MAG: MFS transporter [Kordiimonas sp.]
MRTQPGWKTFVGYGTGDFALNLFWQGTGFYLFFFYANVAGLPNTVIGTIFLVASIWDAVTDPAMGYLAERTTSRWGPYRPYLLLGSVPLALSFFLLFTPVDITSQTWQVTYYLAVLLLFRTCYTLVSIPYSALSARVTRNSDARTKLAGIRMYFGFLGGVCVSFYAKHLLEKYDEATAFSYLGVGAAVASVFILCFCFVSTRESANPINATTTTSSASEGLSSVFSNKPFLLLVGALSLVTVANTVIGQTSLFYFESQFGDRGTGNTAIIIMTAAPLLSIPLWTSITLKIGKRNAWLLGGLIALVGLFLLYVDTSGNVGLALAEITLVTIGVSSYAVLFWSMLPDTIEYGEYQSSVHSESLLIGIASSFQKVTIGLSAFAVGVLLDFIGFKADSSSALTVLAGVKDIYILIPGVALLGSCLLILFYPITAKIHGQIITAIQQKIK